MALAQLFRSALEVERQWTAQGYRFCFIGGVALQRWGEPRSTRDLDLTLMTGFGGEGSYIDQLLAWYLPRIEQARQFALRNRVLLVRDTHGTSLERRSCQLSVVSCQCKGCCGGVLSGVSSALCPLPSALCKEL